MKKIALLFLAIIALSSCEKDDICVENITPKLIIRFYDVSNPTETKEVPSLNVWSDGRDTIINNQTLDSIAIPLDINSNQTIYNFRSNSIIDQLTIDYILNEVYISRSCGFIANYSSLSITSSNNWIQDIDIVSQDIENENSAHVQIRH